MPPARRIPLRRPALAAGGLALLLTVGALLPAHVAWGHACDARGGPEGCGVCLHVRANPGAAAAAPAPAAPAAVAPLAREPLRLPATGRPVHSRGRAPPPGPASV